MEVSRRRVKAASAVAGSVWESRMKLDEVKGGIKVFNGGGGGEKEDKPNEEDSSVNNENGQSKKLVVRKGQNNSVGFSGKRKTWKSSESFDGQIQIRELSASVDGIKKSTIRKGTSSGKDQLSLSVDLDRSPIQIKKGRSEEFKESSVQTRKSRSDVMKEVSVSGVQLRKVKSGSVGNQQDLVLVDQKGSEMNSDNNNSVELRKAKPDAAAADVGLLLTSENDDTSSGNERDPPPETETETEIEVMVIGSGEACKALSVWEEKFIASGESESKQLSEEIIIKPSPNKQNSSSVDTDPVVISDGDEEELEEEEDDDDDHDDEEENEKIKIERKSINVKEMNIQQQEDKPKMVKLTKTETSPTPKPTKTPNNVQEQKPKKAVINTEEQKPKKVVVSEVKKVHHFNNQRVPTSSTINKQPPPVLRKASLYQNLANSVPSVKETKRQDLTETRSRLQNLVDLIMWRDVSRSAFVFGIGTFIIISSSYTKDLNVSFVSVISYMGLAYLAAIFLYRSLICRGVIDVDSTNHVVGEEEAIWLVKLILPYLNECLLKIRALFSGDPSTTMKLAALLFVFARCGGYITIWKMAKLGFFGVFIVPKVCSSYSTQLTAYAKFWMRRFRDAWDKCLHKKAVALGIFTLVWNMSSMVARIWAVFMMFVAVRYYQQTKEKDDWVADDDGSGADNDTWRTPNSTEVNKAEKKY